MSGQARAAIAAAKAKAAKQRIKDIWAARLSVQYKEAKKTSPAEVAAVLNGLDWEEEYTIPGKNTHVCPKICYKHFCSSNFWKHNLEKFIVIFYSEISFFLYFRLKLLTNIIQNWECIIYEWGFCLVIITTCRGLIHANSN